MGVICKYKFDSSIYADFIPEFNSGYSGYVITDEVNGNVTTRTIESDKLPTLMRFGSNLETYVEGSELALLEVLDMNTSGLTSCRRMFRYCINLTSITCEWDTSNVTTMQYMFSNCNKLATLDVRNFDTSNVTGMRSIFNSCFKLTSLDISDWHTSKVADMQQMFYNCNNLTTLDVSNWDTSNATNMQNMFYNCNNLTTLDVSNFDTSKVTTMQNMFFNCNKLTSLDVSNWNTSNVTTMFGMFTDCLNLTSLDISSFDTSNVTNMANMFKNCSSLAELDVSNFGTANVTTMSGMFYNCKNLTSLDVSNWITSNLLGISTMFASTNNLYEIKGINNWDTSKINSVNGCFASCYKIKELDLSNWKLSANITNYEGIFISCYDLRVLNISNFHIPSNANINSFVSNSIKHIILLNSDIDTISRLGLYEGCQNATIYVDESLDQSQYTGTVPLKVYKEEKLEIKLNSPLLEGDTIEVVDGKLCHVHRWDSMILDGNSNWEYFTTNFPTVYAHIKFEKAYADNSKQCVFCENILSEKGSRWSDNSKEMIYIWKWENEKHASSIYLQIYSERLSTENFDGFKQYLSQNPLTIIYKLAEPYYENITPLQSSIVLKTFLESSMTIDTNLPIETKLSYRTNVPSISTLSTRATELAESDNVIHNLMNIIDDEVDE